MLETSKNVVWHSADGRVTSNHYRVTVQCLFSKILLIALNVWKTLFDSRPTVAWPPTTVAWPLSEFFQKFSQLLETSKNVVWQSADGHVTSDHCRVTVQWLFSKNLLITRNVQKTLFGGRQSRDLRPLLRDRSATSVPYSAIFVETSKKFVWNPVKSRLTFRLFCFRGFLRTTSAYAS